MGKHRDNQERSFEDPAKVSLIAVVSDFTIHRNHMETHGCGEDYRTALLQCHPDYQDGAGADADACTKATAALRRCMDADPMQYRAYVRAMDEGLDEDERRVVAGEPPLPPWDYGDCRFRWWTGMKRA